MLEPTRGGNSPSHAQMSPFAQAAASAAPRKKVRFAVADSLQNSAGTVAPSRLRPANGGSYGNTPPTDLLHVSAGPESRGKIEDRENTRFLDAFVKHYTEQRRRQERTDLNAHPNRLVALPPGLRRYHKDANLPNFGEAV